MTENGCPPGKPRDDSRSSVNERRSCELDKRRESERLLGYGPRTVEFPRYVRRHATAVGSDYDVWIENRQKRVEITAAYVKERLTEVAENEDLSRYIL